MTAKVHRNNHAMEDMTMTTNKTANRNMRKSRTAITAGLLLLLLASMGLCGCRSTGISDDSNSTTESDTGDIPADVGSFFLDLSGTNYETEEKHVECFFSDQSVNTVKEAIFGDNISWRGSGYGVWDDSAKQLNQKLVDAIVKAGVRSLRYPGGCEGDYFHWNESIGVDRVPQIDPFSSEYPTYDAANGSRYMPDFGFDEFMQLCDAANIPAVIQLNAGTGTPEEAADLVKYCIEKNYNVSSFCIGNEVNMKDEHIEDLSVTKTPKQYIDFFDKTYAALGDMADRVEMGIIALPASHGLNFIRSWDKKVISALCDKIDFIDFHFGYSPYFTSADDNIEDIYRCYLASYAYVEQMIATAKDEITQYGGANADNISIQITEYGPMGTYYNSVVGSIFLASELEVFLAEPRITSANHLPMINHPAAANLVGYFRDGENEYFWDNVCTYVFRWYEEQCGRAVLDGTVEASVFSSGKIGLIPAISDAKSANCTVYYDAETGEGSFFLTNRSMTSNQRFDVTLPFPQVRITSVAELYDPDPSAYNYYTSPDRVVPTTYETAEDSVSEGTVSLITKPISLVRVDFKVEN